MSTEKIAFSSFADDTVPISNEVEELWMEFECARRTLEEIRYDLRAGLMQLSPAIYIDCVNTQHKIIVGCQKRARRLRKELRERLDDEASKLSGRIWPQELRELLDDEAPKLSGKIWPQLKDALDLSEEILNYKKPADACASTNQVFTPANNVSYDNTQSPQDIPVWMVSSQ